MKRLRKILKQKEGCNLQVKSVPKTRIGPVALASCRNGNTKEGKNEMYFCLFLLICCARSFEFGPDG